MGAGCVELAAWWLPPNPHGVRVDHGGELQAQANAEKGGCPPSRAIWPARIMPSVPRSRNLRVPKSGAHREVGFAPSCLQVVGNRPNSTPL